MTSNVEEAYVATNMMEEAMSYYWQLWGGLASNTTEETVVDAPNLEEAADIIAGTDSKEDVVDVKEETP